VQSCAAERNSFDDCDLKKLILVTSLFRADRNCGLASTRNIVQKKSPDSQALIKLYFCCISFKNVPLKKFEFKTSISSDAQIKL